MPSATPVTLVYLQTNPQKIFDSVPLGTISAGIPIAAQTISGLV